MSAQGIQITVSEEERELLIRLLEQERSDLNPEIHHTDTSEVRDQLNRRKEMVEKLLHRLVRTLTA